MSDQATDLRNLVRRSARSSAAHCGPAPGLIAVVGARRGVGATTTAVNTAILLAQQAKRVVLVDAACQPHAAALCGVSAGAGVGDVLAARRDIHEILERGPAGIQIAPNHDPQARSRQRGASSPQRLIDQIKALGRHADVVVLDVGAGPTAEVAPYWRASDLAAFVTTPDSAAVMDAYATIKAVKSALGDNCQLAIQLIVNRADNAEAARDVFQRIDRSCRRFLDIGAGSLGFVPDDRGVIEAAARATPVVLADPDGPAATALEAIAAAIAPLARAKMSAPAPPAA